MINRKQVQKLLDELAQGRSLAGAALRAGMSTKTARRYALGGQMPEERKKAHTWRTRKDPFDAVWDELLKLLENNSKLEATTLFEHLKGKYPGEYHDGQLRTLQRRLRNWRALNGPGQEVFFPQVHRPGVLSQSDFTDLSDVGVTICGEAFNHLIYHFVLTYSNWESGTICYSESFEALAEGLQNALWSLGRVPEKHQVDCLTAAVQNLHGQHEFQRRYQDFLNYLGLKAQRTNPSSPHENGDIEQRHHRFKNALRQALMLRQSKDFVSLEEYAKFLAALFAQLNSRRQQKLAEELTVMRALPIRRFESAKNLLIRVSSSSTVVIERNTYSVPSRLIGLQLRAALFHDRIELKLGQTKVQELPRLRGRQKQVINYRHIIDWLVRKPGAFENYRFRGELFPTTTFRVAHDALCSRDSRLGTKQYLQLLQLAAFSSEDAVNRAIRTLLHQDALPTPIRVKELLSETSSDLCQIPATEVEQPDLHSYDQLITQFSEDHDD